jgi:hypothetical protein
LATVAPVSVHADAPEVHDVMPTSHGFAGVQLVPLVHALHAPLSQTSFVPHDAPFETLVPVSVHVAVPVAHDVEPMWQGFAGTHVAPAEHPPHAPLSHTPPSHAVPFATLDPVSLHTEEPLVQLVRPEWHGFAGAQVAPAVHELQLPALHTLFVPHVVPFGATPASPPASSTSHTGAPVAQEIAPTRQGFVAGVQLVPALHPEHVPLSQTWPVPQAAPLARLFPVSEQTAEPEVHRMLPAWHGFAGVHDVPDEHAVHEPWSQTSFVPHVVPFAACVVPGSLHTGVPVAHSVEPMSHGLDGVHAAPSVHPMHAPPLQT